MADLLDSSAAHTDCEALPKEMERLELMPSHRTIEGREAQIAKTAGAKEAVDLLQKP